MSTCRKPIVSGSNTAPRRTLIIESSFFGLAVQHTGAETISQSTLLVRRPGLAEAPSKVHKEGWVCESKTARGQNSRRCTGGRGGPHAIGVGR